MAKTKMDYESIVQTLLTYDRNFDNLWKQIYDMNSEITQLAALLGYQKNHDASLPAPMWRKLPKAKKRWFSIPFVLVLAFGLTVFATGQQKKPASIASPDTTISRVVLIQTLEARMDYIEKSTQQTLTAIQAQVNLLKTMTQDSITVRKDQIR